MCIRDRLPNWSGTLAPFPANSTVAPSALDVYKRQASGSGVECLSTIASDSPTLVLNFRDISLREFRTSSLFEATTCS